MMAKDKDEKIVRDSKGRAKGTMKMNEATRRALLADAAARKAAKDKAGT